MSIFKKARFAVAWKAFSVQALALIGTMEFWYPFVRALAESYFGSEAEVYLQMLLALAGIVGWNIPQKGVDDAVSKSNR